jgi:hypothetical protein
LEESCSAAGDNNVVMTPSGHLCAGYYNIKQHIENKMPALEPLLLAAEVRTLNPTLCILQHIGD